MRSISLLTLVTGLISALPLAAQSDVAVTGQSPYGPGVVFEQHEDWGPYCVWAGRERDGSLVYGWENQQKCGTGVIKWGYDLDSDGRLDVYAWPTSCPGTTHPYLNWQWAEGGQISETVIGECIATPPHGFLYKYYLTPQYEEIARNQPDRAWAHMRADCESKLTWLQQRYDIAYKAHQDVATNANANRLSARIAWHLYNRAWLTLESCKRFLRS